MISYFFYNFLTFFSFGYFRPGQFMYKRFKLLVIWEGATFIKEDMFIVFAKFSRPQVVYFFWQTWYAVFFMVDHFQKLRTILFLRPLKWFLLLKQIAVTGVHKFKPSHQNKYFICKGFVIGFLFDLKLLLATGFEFVHDVTAPHFKKFCILSCLSLCVTLQNI